MTIVLVMLSAVTQLGCYPRYTLVQPNLTLTVRDSSGRPISDATVFFVAASNPHHRLHHKDTYTSDASGVVHLESQRQWEFVAPIIIHGVPFYYFAWCAEKAGYGAGRGSLSASDVWCSRDETVTLQPKNNDPECRLEYDQIRTWSEAQPTATAGPLPEEKIRDDSSS